MNQERILSALIGLVGAVNNNGKTENTDSVLANALLSADSDDIIAQIHEEKFTISPNCATCESPCGNTSDYNRKEFEDCTEEVLALKWRIWSMLRPIVDRWQSQRSISNITKEPIESNEIAKDMGAIPEQSNETTNDIEAMPSEPPLRTVNLESDTSSSATKVPELPDIIYKSISYLGYNLEQESYESLLEELTL